MAEKKSSCDNATENFVKSIGHFVEVNETRERVSKIKNTVDQLKEVKICWG